MKKSQLKQLIKEVVTEIYNRKTDEMWMAIPEDSSTVKNAEHDETDLSNPEESREVELAKKIQDLAKELLNMHGVEDKADDEAADTTTEQPKEDSVQEKHHK